MVPPFGYSSFLFVLPFTHSLYLKSVTLWKMALSFLPFSSFLCNRFTKSRIFQTFDHSIITSLSISYFYYLQTYLAFLLSFLYAIEMYFTRECKRVKTLAFFLLNYKAFQKFTNTEWYVGSISLSLSLFAFIYRNYNLRYYKSLTTLWHTGNIILLYLASSNLSKI